VKSGPRAMADGGAVALRFPSRSPPLAAADGNGSGSCFFADLALGFNRFAFDMIEDISGQSDMPSHE
jgi:hypothetical protein